MAGIQRGEGAGAVDADEPVALAAALRGVGQRLHLLVAAQLFEGVQNRALGHGLHPQALDRLFAARGVHDVTENQLPLAAGVAGIDEGVHVLALHQAGQDLVTVLALLDGVQFEDFRQNGQAGEAPADLFAVHHRHPQLQQMAHGAGNDMRLVFIPVLFLRERLHAGGFGQRAGEIGGDAGLLGNNQGFGHVVGCTI